MVGSVLRQTPNDVRLPWHRVLRSDGRIAFEPGSEQFVEQVERLRAEGVIVNEGRVDFTEYGASHSLDEMLWGPRS